MVARVSVERIELKKLFLDRLPAVIRRAFLSCSKWQLLRRSGWYLAGGTALALQVGHRQSVDLDFFTTQTKIRERALERRLLATGKWQTSYLEEGTVYGAYQGAKMSFIAYPFFIPSSIESRCGSVRLLSPADIAAMKIIAISQRGRKRDFVDLYWYCLNHEPLESVVRRAAAQYPGQENNLAHIVKSLAYFADAEADPMPRLFFRVTWPGVKQFFRREAVALARRLLLA